MRPRRNPPKGKQRQASYRTWLIIVPVVLTGALTLAQYRQASRHPQGPPQQSQTVRTRSLSDLAKEATEMAKLHHELAEKSGDDPTVTGLSHGNYPKAMRSI